MACLWWKCSRRWKFPADECRLAVKVLSHLYMLAIVCRSQHRLQHYKKQLGRLDSGSCWYISPQIFLRLHTNDIPCSTMMTVWLSRCIYYRDFECLSTEPDAIYLLYSSHNFFCFSQSFLSFFNWLFGTSSPLFIFTGMPSSSH